MVSEVPPLRKLPAMGPAQVEVHLALLEVPRTVLPEVPSSDQSHPAEAPSLDHSRVVVALLGSRPVVALLDSLVVALLGSRLVAALLGSPEVALLGSPVVAPLVVA